MNRPLLTDLLDIQYPVILAPMFLVSNTKMVMAALDAGITAAIPALNYRTDEQLRAAIHEIKAYSDKPFGINLIVNKSNIYFPKQLDTCVELGVDFFITSLGSPKSVIDKSKAKGIKVFCDVINGEQAEKVEKLGADALIAVDNSAGGHCGPTDKEILMRDLISSSKLPIISAGGISNSEKLKQAMELGAAGASVGTIFIASHEAEVSQEYKQAMVDYGAKDIVLTTKISGSPCTVINTPYVQKIGTKESFLEWLMNRNKTLKKYVKMVIYKRGMDKVRNAAFKATYKTVWCAGPSIEDVKEIRSVKEIANDLTSGLPN